MKFFLGRDIIKPKIYAERIFYLLYHFLKLSYHSPERGGCRRCMTWLRGGAGGGGRAKFSGPGTRLDKGRVRPCTGVRKVWDRGNCQTRVWEKFSCSIYVFLYWYLLKIQQNTVKCEANSVAMWILTHENGGGLNQSVRMVWDREEGFAKVQNRVIWYLNTPYE